MDRPHLLQVLLQREERSPHTRTAVVVVGAEDGHNVDAVADVVDAQHNKDCAALVDAEDVSEGGGDTSQVATSEVGVDVHKHIHLHTLEVAVVGAEMPVPVEEGHLPVRELRSAHLRT